VDCLAEVLLFYALPLPIFEQAISMYLEEPVGTSAFGLFLQDVAPLLDSILLGLAASGESVDQ
jgi:hypothetical protein